MVLQDTDGLHIETSVDSRGNHNSFNVSVVPTNEVHEDIVIASAAREVASRAHKRYVSFTGDAAAAVNILTLAQPAAATNVYARSVFVSNATGTGTGNMQETIWFLSNPGGGNWTAVVAQDAAPGNHIISADLTVGDGTTAWTTGASTTVLSFDTDGHAGACTGYVELIYCNSGN